MRIKEEQSFYKSKESLYIRMHVFMYIFMYVPRIARKLFIRLNSNLAGVLLMTQGCASVHLMQFGHASHLLL